MRGMVSAAIEVVRWGMDEHWEDGECCKVAARVKLVKETENECRPIEAQLDQKMGTAGARTMVREMSSVAVSASAYPWSFKSICQDNEPYSYTGSSLKKRTPLSTPSSKPTSSLDSSLSCPASTLCYR